MYSRKGRKKLVGAEGKELSEMSCQRDGQHLVVEDFRLYLKI